MKAKRLDINFSPLKVLTSLSIPGGEAQPGSAIDGIIPNVQYYDAQEREHIPDYTIAHLVIQPMVKVIDRDGWIANGDVTSRLTNMRWSVLSGTSSVATPISMGIDYGIVTEGPTRGQLIVCKNIPVGESRTYVFDADWRDPRTNRPHTIHATMLVRCLNASEAPLRIEMNSNTALVWDPLDRRAEALRTRRIEVWITRDGQRVDPDNAYFVWYKRRAHGGWSLYGSDPVMDYEMSADNGIAGLNASSAVRVIALDKCGEGMELRILGHYNGQGIYQQDRDAALEADIDLANVPRRTLHIARRLHEWEDDYHLPVNISPGESFVQPRAEIKDAEGTLPEQAINRALHIKWHTRANDTGVHMAWEYVAEGISPTIHVNKMLPPSSGYHMELGMEVVDRGPAAAWQDADGAILTDADGAVLLLQ